MIGDSFTANSDFKRMGTIELGKIASYLRYGSEAVEAESQPLLTYNCLSRLLRVSIRRCHQAVRQYSIHKQQQQQETQPEWAGSRRRTGGLNLTQIELDQLVTKESLERDAQLSLEARVAMFNQHNPGRRLKRHQLRAIFKTHGIKKKVVLRRMVSTKSREKQKEEQVRFFQEYNQVVSRGDELVMIDECVFSSKGYQHCVWTQPAQNIVLSKRFQDTTCVAVVAAISDKQGLIAYLAKRKSIKADDFCYFLGCLYKRMKRRQFTMLLDQASIHRARDTQMALRGRSVLFNIAYSPWYNGIELFWAQCKQYYRKALLRRMLDASQLKIEQLVDDALDSVPEERVRACASSALKRIQKDKEMLV